QQRLRRVLDGDVRGGGLHVQQAEDGAGAPADRLRARPDDGGAPAARHAAVARQRMGFRGAADQRHHAGDWGHRPAGDDAAQPAEGEGAGDGRL
ncbi:MAG: Tripartite tricarboxylate transporter TctA family, partial [uncultured Acetobacteraceae bacterium]